MKKHVLKLFLTAGLMMNVVPLVADCGDYSSCGCCGPAWNVIDDIPLIDAIDPRFDYAGEVAQYKQGDWSKVVGRKNGISLEEAKKIADSNPAITFFFYVKGGQMVLETNETDARVFNYGDAVFFSGTPQWGTAPGLADGYVKK